MYLWKFNVAATGSKGSRKHMEDYYIVEVNEKGYGFFGVFDGHGGKEAARYAKNYLLDNITSLKNFWENDDELILKAIKDGFLNTHLTMWKEVDKWPKTSSGLPSTSGTTASVVFLRNGKLYIGHVGDSRIILGVKNPDCAEWKAQCLTVDHKPNSPSEKERIFESGGTVRNKSGIERIVWKRPKMNHQDSDLEAEDFEEVPFLAVSRSLGDFWSYNSMQQEFVVSPEPDVSVVELDEDKHVCLILASDGLWDIFTPDHVIAFYQDFMTVDDDEGIFQKPLSPAHAIVDYALVNCKARADNMTVIVLTFYKEDCSTELNSYFSSCQSKQTKTTAQAKSASECCKEAEAFSDTDEDIENSIGHLKCASRAGSEKDCGSELERHSSSPLQSCSNFLPEHCPPASPKHFRKSDLLAIESYRSCPFPRWSKSASGRTSLSKLATWSKVVNHRRMSDPFPHHSVEYNQPIGHMYSLSDDENSDCPLFSVENSENEPEHSCQQFEICDLEDITCQTLTKSKTAGQEDRTCRTALNNLYGIKQAIKRKYTGFDVFQSCIGNSSSLDDLSSQQKKPDLINFNKLKMVKTLHVTDS